MAFELDEPLVLVRTATPDRLIVNLHGSKKLVLLLKHYPVLASHTVRRKVYTKLRKHFYWLALVTDCYATVCSFTDCT